MSVARIHTAFSKERFLEAREFPGTVHSKFEALRKLFIRSNSNNLLVKFKSDSEGFGNFLYLVRVVGPSTTRAEIDETCTTRGSRYKGEESCANSNITNTCVQCEKWPLEDIGKYPDQNLRPEWPAVSPFHRSILNKDMGFTEI